MKSLTCNEIDTIAKHLSSYSIDKRLIDCTLVLNNKGKPWTISGGQCRVYKVKTNNGEIKALRFWNNTMGEAEKRCSAISAYLSLYPSSFFLSFEFINQGFRYNSESYPVILMDWCPAIGLKSYVKKNLQNKEILQRLQNEIVRMVKFLHNCNISHGDLHHDNIRVSPDGSLVLIDYDSLYVPSLRGYSDDCMGYTGYQHPLARSKNQKLSPKTDYFSELILYLSIEVLIEMPDMWDKLSIDNSDQSFVFTANDFGNLTALEIYRVLKGKSQRLSILLDILSYYLAKDQVDELVPFYDATSFLGFPSLIETESIFCINCGVKFVMDDFYCIKCGCKLI